MLGVYCGLDEQTIDNCSYLFYKDCVDELGIKLNYDAIVHILGNSYAENSGDMVAEANPFKIDPKAEKKPKKLTLDDIQKSGFEVKKLNNVKLIKDMIPQEKKE